MSTTDFKKYLPSKKFTASLITIIVVVALGFLIKEVFSFAKNLINKNKDNNGQVEVTTVADIIQEDSNNNGIPDWEEYIWGLDPTKNGPENKAFILAKKKTMTESGEVAIDEEGRVISDNEMLSRSYLSTLMALQASDNLTEESINSLSEAIGQEITVSDLPDKYFAENLHIIETSNDSLLLYYQEFIDIYVKYEALDVGNEMTLVSIGISSGDAQPLRAAKTIASYYKSMAEELSKIDIPSSVYKTHLKLINNIDKIADSLDGLTMSLANPILGMKSIILYNKYNNDFSTAMDEMMEILQLN